MRPRVSTSSSRMSCSSSTIRALGAGALAGSLMAFTLAEAPAPALCRQHRVRVRQADAEAAALGPRQVLQGGLVGHAKRAGDVEAQPGAVLGGGEERTEQLGADVF